MDERRQQTPALRSSWRVVRCSSPLARSPRICFYYQRLALGRRSAGDEELGRLRNRELGDPRRFADRKLDLTTRKKAPNQQPPIEGCTTLTRAKRVGGARCVPPFCASR